MKFTNYSINVHAFTRAGVSKKSSALFCQTQEDAPSSPEDIKAVISGQESVIVSWRPPKFPNGRIQKYTIFRREMFEGDEINLKESSVLSGPNYIELGALQYNRRYDIWVKAETSAGYGSPSDVTSVILGSTIQAQIVSFGESLTIPWKKNLVLDCLNVGIPIPSIEWKHRGNSIMENSKYQIYPNGSLSIHHIDEGDESDYRCVVQNIHGSDEVVYNIIVQVPPKAPLLTLKNVTFTSARLSWRSTPSIKEPIMGFTIFYRREHGKWHIVKENPFTETDWIHDFVPSTIISAKTSGFIPEITKKVVTSNITMVLVDLTAFYDGGCPILYFVLEYKKDTQPKYTMVSNNVSPLDEEYTIRGLDPGTQYFIRITAHNSAGSSVTEFAFSTLSSLGSELPPPIKDSREHRTSVWSWIIRIVTFFVIIGGIIMATAYGSIVLRKLRNKTDEDDQDNLRSTMDRRQSYPKISVVDHGSGGHVGLVCSAQGASNRGHTLSQVFQPCSTTKTTDTWIDPDMYPFATFSTQPGNPRQVTLNLQHPHSHQRMCSYGNIFASSTPGVINPSMMTTTTCPLTGTEVVTINGFDTLVEPMYSKVNCRSEEFLSRQVPSSTPPVRSENYSILKFDMIVTRMSTTDQNFKGKKPPNKGKLKRRAQVITAQRYSSSSSEENDSPMQQRLGTTISDH
ncbi:unnamed protein product [Lepeophtheirus salmonis]|uniref:(salmon louse) hypothetical protein n=1 Tax=Lepeophtheirus salmonis TaxID=72036 RepID=A0A7R8CUY2_LEPSM|nr:unnamed protein product [Lepeophtheirus salmonis]CAF2940510.1 unnamed protein product [Lepeophtheirus salmonis]